jgi:hypothetical protein
MKAMSRAVVIALVQILLICSLGAKLLYDRRTCPQAWFKTRQYDPNLPIRGRYISLQVEVKDPRSPEEIGSKFGNEIKAQENMRAQNTWRGPFDFGRECGSIAARDGVPVAVFDANGPSGVCDNLSFTRQRLEGAAIGTILWVNEPVLFFIPDTADVPTRTRDGAELWVLATIPRKGPPRAIALGLKKVGESEIRRLQIN